MVKAAIEVAVSASISIPVLALPFTIAVMIIFLFSKVKSIFTDSIGIGWHKGISSGVFFAAKIPANFAASKQSPLGIFLLLINSITRGLMKTMHSATAWRAVTR